MASLLFAAAVLVATSSTTSFAAEASDDLWSDSWSCGKTFTPTSRLVRALANKDFDGYRGDPGTPPFLIASLPPLSHGIVVFVKQPSGWTGIAVESISAVQGAFVAKGKGRLMLFSMVSVEGPGSSYTLLRASDGLASTACTTIGFPAEVPVPETYLSLQGFNAKETGEGTLTGSAEFEERGRSVTKWYEYRTTNGGESWSEPRRLNTKPGPIAGIY